MKQPLLLKPLPLAILLSLLFAAGYVIYGASWFASAEHQVYQSLVASRAKAPASPSKDIVLVELNDNNTQLRERLPWRTQRLVQLLKKLRKSKPQVVAINDPLLRRVRWRDKNLRLKFVTKLFNQVFPEKKEDPNKKKKRRRRRLSKRELVKLADAKRIAFLRKGLNKVANEDPYLALQKEIKAGKKTYVLGYHYYPDQDKIVGQDMRYIKRKERALDKRKGKKKKVSSGDTAPLVRLRPLPPKKGAKKKDKKDKKDDKKPATPKKPKKKEFVLFTPFHLGAATMVGGATDEPAPVAYAIRDNNELMPEVKYHGFLNLQDGPAKLLEAVPMFMKHKGKVFPSLALATYIAYKSGSQPARTINRKGYISVKIGKTELPLTNDGQFKLDYQWPANKFPKEQRVLAGDVLGKDFNTGVFKNKIVLLGVSSNRLQESFRSPFPQNFSSLEVQATILDNLLQRKTVSRPGVNVFIEAGLLVGLGLLLGLFLMFLRGFNGFLFTAIIIGALAFANSYYVFPSGQWFQFLYIQVALFLIFLVVNAINKWAAAGVLQQASLSFVGRVDKKDFKRLMKDSKVLNSEGKRQPVTAVSGKIRPFGSCFAPTMEPKRVVNLLSYFVSPLTAAATRHHGLVHQAEGHVIQASFNVVQESKAHILQGAEAALQMRFEWDSFAPHLEQEGVELPTFALGLATGDGFVGNIGGDKAFLYRAVGEPVDQSELLRDVAVKYNATVVVSEEVAQQLQETGQYWVRELDWVRFQNQPAVALYELLGKSTEQSPYPEAVQLYQQGLAAYRAKDFDTAVRSFQQLLQIRPDDGPAQLMMLRSQEFKMSAPSFQWDGASDF